MSRLATLTKTDRVTPEEPWRTASATIAWFFRSRPTGRTVMSCSRRVVGFVASAASVATRISASPDRAARASARFRASPRSPEAGETARFSIAARTRPRSLVALTTTRAVRPAAMTLTLPPAGSSRSASRACCLAAVRRSGATSVAAMLAETSMTRTRSLASPAGRSRNGRAASAARMRTRRIWRSRRRLRRRRCQGAFASTSATRRCHKSVEGTTASSRRSLRRYIATTAGTKIRPRRARGEMKLIALPHDLSSPQLGEHEVGQGYARRERHVRRAPPGREIGEPLAPGLEAGLVAVEGGEVDGDIDALARFDVDEPEIALEGRVELLGREEVEDDQLRAGRRQLADHPVGVGIEEVGQEDDDAPAGQLRRGVPD